MSKDYFIIPIFVPHEGCPHNCIFCNQRKITGSSTSTTANIVKEIIESHLQTIDISKNPKLEVAFYGGSFTGIDIEKQRELLQVAYNYKKRGFIDGIRLSTRPDYIDEEILNLLKEYDVDTIELGVQSLDEDVLKASYRGHSVQDVYNASELIKSWGFNLGHQMMIGLPLDTKEKSINTAKSIIKLNPYCVRIYPTLVVKDTYLEKMYKEETYKPLPLKEAVSLCTDLLIMFEFNNIDVIRIGLQPTDNINWGKDVIAGPFHPAFRQLVVSNIYKLVLDDFFDNIRKEKYDNKSIVFYLNEREISNFVGQGAKNMKYIKNKYDLKSVKINKMCNSSEKIYAEVGKQSYEIFIRDAIEKLIEKRGLSV